MKKGILAVIGLAVVGGAAFALFPKTASASPLQPGEDRVPPEGEPVNPKNAAEAYSLGINPKMTNPDYVHSLAMWLNSSGGRPDWAEALLRREMNLRAEVLLAEGLKDTTSIDRLVEIGNTLKTTHEKYATVVGLRITVMRGGPVPPSFVLPLDSGSGSLTIDLSVFAPKPSPAAGGYQNPVGPAAGGTISPSAVAPPVAPTAAAPALTTPPPPVPYSVAVPPGTVVQTPGGTPQPAGPGAAVPSLASVEVQPDLDPNGTVALARLMLDEQNKPGWKYVSKSVEDWQRKKGMTADGKFGVGSWLIMAQEVGVLPWIRYFSVKGPSTKAAAVADARGRLKAYALSIGKTKPDLAAALLRAADLEAGQGWPASTPKAAPGTPATTAELERYITVLETALRQKVQ